MVPSYDNIPSNNKKLKIPSSFAPVDVVAKPRGNQQELSDEDEEIESRHLQHREKRYQYEPWC